MTSRSPNFNASALDEYANQLLGQIYPPDEQCGLIQGDGSYMCRVSTVISEIPVGINTELKFLRKVIYLRK